MIFDDCMSWQINDIPLKSSTVDKVNGWSMYGEPEAAAQYSDEIL